MPKPPSRKEAEAPLADQHSQKATSTLDPLKRTVFRRLWMVWLAANCCMWMNDVSAAWMMASLTPAPIWVALVQTASTLPVFLLGLPSGALADILDRRRYFIVTQIWVAAVACILALVIFFGTMTPGLLLMLVFANGIGLAMRWPVYASIVPMLVPRTELPDALALNGLAMNVSRIVGPLLAGAMIAAAGSAYVFVLNAVISLACTLVILRWRHESTHSSLGRERLFSAIRVGVQYVAQSGKLKGLLLRTFVFFFHSTALLALLPLIARSMGAGNATTYTVLLASMGAGAIAAALLLPRVRSLIRRDALVLYGVVVQAASTAVIAAAPNVIVCTIGMATAGMAWILAANSLSVSVQLALPDWVRARGMSIFQMAIMGGGAIGAAVWGQIATFIDIQVALLTSAAGSVLAMLLVHRLSVNKENEEDLTPSNAWSTPTAELPPHSGPIVVTIEYVIDPAKEHEFALLMQESRRSRLRQGARAWSLLSDISNPGHYVEQVVDESWSEHLRRFERVTAADIALRERKLAFHLRNEPPRITRMVMKFS